MSPSSDNPLTPDLFARLDESDDSIFYLPPRKVVHIDEAAIAAVESFFAEILPPNGELLDVMSSWRSHLPPALARKRVVGLGMNGEEMADNPDLDEWVVHDLNRNPELPFADASFDAATLVVSMQYLTKPIDVFRSLARCLRPAAPLVVVISHRCFPTKAVAIWNRCASMRERMELAMAYFTYAGEYAEVMGVDLRPGLRPGEDPVLAIVGRRIGTPDVRPRATATWRRR